MSPVWLYHTKIEYLLRSFSKSFEITISENSRTERTSYTCFIGPETTQSCLCRWECGVSATGGDDLTTMQSPLPGYPGKQYITTRSVHSRGAPANTRSARDATSHHTTRRRRRRPRRPLTLEQQFFPPRHHGARRFLPSPF
jgi:hypothetical protein